MNFISNVKNKMFGPLVIKLSPSLITHLIAHDSTKKGSYTILYGDLLINSPYYCAINTVALKRDRWLLFMIIIKSLGEGGGRELITLYVIMIITYIIITYIWVWLETIRSAMRLWSNSCISTSDFIDVYTRYLIYSFSFDMDGELHDDIFCFLCLYICRGSLITHGAWIHDPTNHCDLRKS